jgi:hypothetical protein
MIYALLGAAFAVAGADKMSGDKGYEEMFEHLGWSQDGMRAVAAAEMTGGVLLGVRRTRRLGAGILAGTSMAVLASEMRRGEAKLAGPRGLLLLASLIALLAPDRG